jgi:cytochrome b subunit of formate dehydrogenase
MVSSPETSPPPGVRLVRKHHLLVRVSHWLNVLLLAGLIVSGISILLGVAGLSTQSGPANRQHRLLC